MRKNIWIWNHYATDMYKNHGGRHYWFAENLIKQGYRATVFGANTYHNKAEYIDTGDKKYAIDNINNIPFVFVKTTPALGNGVARVKNMGLFYINLFSVAKTYAKINGKPDVILASSVHPLTMLAGIQIARRLKVPCICEIRDLWPEAIFSFNKAKGKSLLGKILTAGEHWIYKKADALIFTKEGDTDYIKEKGWDTDHGGNVDLKKCHYINNGIDLNAFIKLAKENVVVDEDLATDKFNVVYAGAIRPVNNVGNILDAAALLKDESDIQFLIYGDGNQQEKLQQRVIDEEITNVKMKGYINKQFIPYILSKSSVNILNYSQSQYNWARGNSSNKLFEYMASGKPVISTVKMGYCIISKYNCGLSLDECTPQALTTAILDVKNLLKDEYIKLCNNAKTGAKDFDFGVLTDKLIDVINSVLHKEKETMINVIGLGYIGLSTALMFASHGLDVVGTYCNKELVETLQAGRTTMTNSKASLFSIQERSAILRVHTGCKLFKLEDLQMNAVGLYRAGNWFYKHKIPVFPKMFHGLIYLIFNSHIPYTTQIGNGTRFAYGGMAVVLHSNCVIGDNCMIGTCVTVGGNKKGGGVPTIGNRCYIATGAKIFGGITIGDGSFIGANSVVTSHVPPNSLVAGIPAKVIKENINICDYDAHMISI